MSAALLGLLAESHIHPGTGQSDGTVDLPVARERPTGYPFVPGSSAKGALKEVVERRNHAAVERWFGVQETAGQVMVSDARLLLLPTRSLTGSYRWLTCPYLVERLVRDRRRVGLSTPTAALGFPGLATVGASPVIAAGTGQLFLEERSFKIVAAPAPELVTLLGEVIGDEQARKRLGEQLAVIKDDDFAWFARYALSIQARNTLSNQKTSTNLWYEETLPPDTVLYLTLSDRFTGPDDGKSNDGPGSTGLAKLFSQKPYLQLGGNETVGQGWFLVRPLIGEG